MVWVRTGCDATCQHGCGGLHVHSATPRSGGTSSGSGAEQAGPGKRRTTRIVHPASIASSPRAVDVSTGDIDDDTPTCDPTFSKEAHADALSGMHAAHAQLDAHKSRDDVMDAESAASEASEPSQQLPPPPFSTLTTSMTSQLLTDSGTSDPAVATARIHGNAVFMQSTTSTEGGPSSMHGVALATTTAATANRTVDSSQRRRRVGLTQGAFTSSTVAAECSNDRETSTHSAHAHAHADTPPVLRNVRSVHVAHASGAGASEAVSTRDSAPTTRAQNAGRAVHGAGPDVAMTVSVEALEASSALGISHDEVAGMLDTLLSNLSLIHI